MSAKMEGPQTVTEAHEPKPEMSGPNSEEVRVGAAFGAGPCARHGALRKTVRPF